MNDLVDLTGRHIIVAGGSSGAGEAAIDAYLAAGARVASLDVAPNEADDARPAESFRAWRCDVGVKDEVDARVDEAVAFLGGLDAICVPAGITERRAPEDISEEDMRRIFQVNVLGTMFTNQAAFRHMKDSGGSIINFASASGIRGLPNRAHYCATKGAVAAWTRAIAIDWAKYNIRANALAPMMYTKITDKIIAAMPEADRPAYVANLGSMQRLPGGLRGPEALAPMLTLLASDGASYMTGQILSLDGGYMMLGS